MSIHDDVLKKYIYLKSIQIKLKTLTPNQNYRNFKRFKKNDALILNETKDIYKKTGDYTKSL